MRVTNVTDALEYQDFINSFIEDNNYSDPHLTARIEAGESLVCRGVTFFFGKELP